MHQEDLYYKTKKTIRSKADGFEHYTNILYS